MAKEFINGLMEKNMTDFTKKIKNMDLGFISGQTVKSSKVIGSLGNSMEKANLPIQKGSQNLDFGNSVKENTGSKINELNNSSNTFQF